MTLPLVVAITGSSGVIYGRRLVEVLCQLDHPLHLVVSQSGAQVMRHELKLAIDPNQPDLVQLLPGVGHDNSSVQVHGIMDFMAPIASGSHRTAAMVICPCSGATLSSVAAGSSRNLIERAADVHLKERRPLILVPREAPLSLIHIENMRSVTLAGGTIIPASPGFYHDRIELTALVDFVVARILDQVGIEHDLSSRWGHHE